MKIAKLTLGISFSLITSQILYAADAETESTDIKTRKMNAIVTSATGFDLPLKDEARNIVIIDKAELTNKGYQSLEQALQYNPLLTFTNSGFGNNIDLRGQGPDANRAVKILVNRVPISLLDTSHGVPPYNNIDIEDIESIEVIPGGGAVVYGNGTRGGVINIVTKMPSHDFTRVVLKGFSGEKLGLQGGSLSLALGRKIGDNLFVRGDVSGGYAAGVRNAAGTDTTGAKIDAFTNDNVTNFYTAFQAIYQISEDSKLDFNANYSHLWTNRPITYLSLQGTQGTRPNLTTFEKNQSQLESERNNPDEYTMKTQTDSMQTSLNYTTKFSESLSFDALAFYQFSLLRYTQYEYCLSTKATAAFNCPAGIMNMGEPSGFANHGGGLNLKVKWNTDKNMLIVGLDNIIEYSNRINNVNHIWPGRQGNGTGNAPTPNPQTIHYIANIENTATKLSNSLYVYDKYNFTESFSLGGGGRVELSNYWTTNDQNYWTRTRTWTNGNQNSTTFNEVTEDLVFNYNTTRLGYALELTPSYKYSDSGNVYAKAELGFISPSAYQMINADPANNNGGRLNRNTANGVKPEQYITAEVGVKDEIVFDALSLYGSATIFYTHTFDEIYVNSISHGTSYTYGNLGQTARAGLELISTQKFFNTEWLRLSESVSALYTQVLKTNIATSHLQGRMVPYVPWLKATINIEADVFKSDRQFLTLFWNNAYYSQSIDSTSAGSSSSTGDTANATGSSATSHIMNKGGYFLSDVGLMYGFSAVKVNLGVRNLFDSWYATYQKYPNYIPALGRSYYAELRYTF